MTGLCVLASGMVTPLGFNAASTLAALRAGVSAVGALPWMDPNAAKPLKGARVRLPHWWFGVGMLADIIAPAIHECLAAAGNEPPSDIPILLGVSAPSRQGRPAGLSETLLGEVYERLDRPIHRRSAVIARDQAACAQAIIMANQILAAGDARLVIVAGVDSFLDRPMLKGYIDRRRLMTASNSNGFYPGEAGCAVLLGAAGTAQPDHLLILGIGTALEPATIDGTEPFQATGMTQACQKALAAAGVTMSDIGWRLTDLSGEHYKFKEATFVAGRLDTAVRSSPLDLWHPIEYLGEIGAAVLPCLLALAMHAGQRGYAPGLIAMCHVGSDAGERAAMVVRYQGSVRQEEL